MNDKPSYPNDDMISDFATKPLNSGNAEIEIAPIIEHTAVIGIYLNNPPNSDAFQVPTLYKTAPILINKRPL